MAWPGNRVQQMVIAKVIAKQPLQRMTLFTNIWHCSKEICHKTGGRERERERERASWMPNAMVTAGNRAPQVKFPSSVLPGPFCECAQPYLLGLRQIWRTVAHGPRLSLLGGPYRCTVFRAHLWQKFLQYHSNLQPFWPWLIYSYYTHIGLGHGEALLQKDE